MIAYKKDYIIATATVPHSEWDTAEWTDIKFSEKWYEVFPKRFISSLEWTSTGYIVKFSVDCGDNDEICA